MDFHIERYGFTNPYYQVWTKEKGGPNLVALIKKGEDNKWSLTYYPSLVGMLDVIKLEREVVKINLGLYSNNVLQFYRYLDGVS